MLIEALRWRKLEVSVIPIRPNSKYFDTIAMRNRGYVLADLREKLPTEDDLIYWFNDGGRGLAVVCNDMVVVDFDDEKGYRKFKDEYPTLSCTFTVSTPRPGYHVHYLVKNEIKNKLEVTWPNVEIKHGGQAIIAAGPGYKPVDNGLLNIFSMLKIKNALILPMAKEIEKKESTTERKTFPLMRCNSSLDPISRIKSVLPISSYLSSLGHELVQSGDGKFITYCPFHDDVKEKSFWIDDNFNNCNCFKSDCQTSRAMDILDLFRRLNSCTLGMAISQLATSLNF